MEAVLADLEQFKLLAEQTHPPEQCKSLLTKLKIGLTKLDVPSPREMQPGSKAAYVASVYYVMWKRLP